MATTSNRRPLSDLGKEGLENHLAAHFVAKNDCTLQGIGDDAAVAYFQDPLSVTAQQLMLEGVDFDLSYVPLKYLGYKAAVGAMGQVMAMNAVPLQLLVTAGVSQRFFVEDMDALFSGIAAAAQRYGADVVNLEVKSSYTGLTLCVTALGQAEAGLLTRRSGAQDTDLLCLSGNVGAAYMGLRLLEREKRIFTGQTDKDETPNLQGYEYILERYLKPELPSALLANLRQDELIPTSMCLLTNGLAHGVLSVAKASGVGAKIFLDKIPIARQCFTFADEAAKEIEGAPIDPIVAALNGGDDYEILFTLPLSIYDQINTAYNIDVIGHICDASLGCTLVTPNGQPIPLSSPGM